MKDSYKAYVSVAGRALLALMFIMSGFGKLTDIQGTAGFIASVRDVRANPKLSGTKHNVFGIQIGVAITFMVRRHKAKGCRIFYARA